MPSSGYSGFLGIPLAHLAIRCRHGLEKWPACRNRIEALLSRLVVHGSFRGSHHGPLSNLCVDHASHCACPVHGSSAGSVPFTSKYGPHSQPAGNRLSCPASFSATCAPFWLHASLLFQFPKAWEQSCCWLLKYYLSISSVFQKPKP